MRRIRIYSAEPLTAHAPAELGAGPARHVGQVLRMQPGQALTLFDGLGGEYQAEITHCTRDKLRVAVGEHTPRECESPLQVTLWHALCKATRMDSIVQKATELGVACIQPVHTERSQVKLNAARAQRKVRHWTDIAIGACEQSGRNRLPVIAAPAAFGALLPLAARFDRALLLDPDGEEPMGAVKLGAGTALVLTGPEGGFSAAERAAAAAHGIASVSLGPRVLRTETAPVAALAILQALAGDFRTTQARRAD
ncbi:MAG: 16S rRNA (uracil(1498)-N(3))-methyltransferase [Gammaproteobacteria bacterium]|jgi:16S rRNA (uracil1498-N3)-methyltransferase|nr:16S rRNA (uracil(1498)-N(3))-methyltransferase [Gammaproteobacteria bacterium]